MIFSMEPTRLATARARREGVPNPSRLLVAITSPPLSDTSFVWPAWLAPVQRAWRHRAVRFFPIAELNRSRSK
jgi:hypothetical protein